MRNTERFCLIAIAFGLCAASSGLGRSALAAAPAATICAVIPGASFNASDLALIDLLEVELSASPDLTVLSRMDLERMLSEQEVRLTLGDDRRESRRTLGGILRADLLMLIEVTSMEGGRVIDMEISETRHGLRLARDMFAWTDDADSLVKHMVESVTRCALTARTGIRYIFAVPPFETGDFLYDAAYLKNGLALVAESSLASVPGVVVVDIANADRIAKELSITRGDGSVERDLPLYLLGRYATQGRGDSRTTDLRLELRRADQLLAEVATNGLQSDAVGEFVRATARAFLETVTDGQQPQTSVTVGLATEADLLEDRLNAFRLTGEWDQVVQLAEACLLLDPRRTLLHWRAFEGINRLVTLDAEGEDQLSRPLAVLRGLEHLESHIRNYDTLIGLPIKEVRDFLVKSEPSIKLFSSWSHERFRTLYTECHKAKWQFLRSVLAHPPVFEQFNNARQAGAVCAIVGLGAEDLLRAPYSSRYPRVSNDVVAAVLCGLDRFSGSLPRQMAILHYGRGRVENFDRLAQDVAARSSGSAILAVECERAVATADESQSVDAVVQTVRELCQRGDHGTQEVAQVLALTETWAKSRRRPSEVNPFEIIVLGDIRFTPIEFKNKDLVWNSKWTNWLTFGCDFEVVHDKTNLFFMRQPAFLEPCTQLQSREEIEDVAWDGRYLWIARRSPTRPVTVFDPHESAIVAEFTNADGVPPATMGCKLAPLGVGHAFVAGAFGRSWLATLQIDERVGKQAVSVIRESPEVADLGTPPSTQAPVEIAFVPIEVIAVQREQGGLPWIIVRRDIDLPNVMATPLLVNLTDKSVSALPDQWFTNDRAHIDGVSVNLYHLHSLNGDFGIHAIGACRPPTFEIKCNPRHVFRSQIHHATGSRTAPGYSVRIGDHVHVVSEKWLTFNLDTAEVERSVDMPKGWWFGGLVNSQFHGLVRYAASGKPRGAFEVSFSSDSN